MYLILGGLYSGKTNSKTTPKWSTNNLVEVKRLNLPYMNNILIQPPTIWLCTVIGSSGVCNKTVSHVWGFFVHFCLAIILVNSTHHTWVLRFWKTAWFWSWISICMWCPHVEVVRETSLSVYKKCSIGCCSHSLDVKELGRCEDLTQVNKSQIIMDRLLN